MKAFWDKNSTHIIVFVITMAMAFTQGCAPQKGKQGPAGPQGIPGAPGANCSVKTVQPNDVTPNGGSLIECPDGTSSLVLNGANGRDGMDGTNGQDGKDGTVVDAVKFCGETPHYPSTFVEVGFVINGHLYAVYSEKGGFMTELTPGRYESNAIGSRCSFTVNADLSITR